MSHVKCLKISRKCRSTPSFWSLKSRHLKSRIKVMYKNLITLYQPTHKQTIKQIFPHEPNQTLLCQKQFSISAQFLRFFLSSFLVFWSHKKAQTEQTNHNLYSIVFGFFLHNFQKRNEDSMQSVLENLKLWKIVHDNRYFSFSFVVCEVFSFAYVCY